jgi:hypothetical protein
LCSTLPQTYLHNLISIPNSAEPTHLKRGNERSPHRDDPYLPCLSRRSRATIYVPLNFPDSDLALPASSKRFPRQIL